MPIQSIVGGSGTYSAANGGKIYLFNDVSTALLQVAPASPTRQQITFHNPGAVDIFVAPASAVFNGSNIVFNPSNALLGGCFRVFGNGGTLVITGECQIAWRAFALSGTLNPFTVMDSNIS